MKKITDVKNKLTHITWYDHNQTLNLLNFYCNTLQINCKQIDFFGFYLFAMRFWHIEILQNCNNFFWKCNKWNAIKYFGIFMVCYFQCAINSILLHCNLFAISLWFIWQCLIIIGIIYFPNAKRVLFFVLFFSIFTFIFTFKNS